MGQRIDYFFVPLDRVNYVQDSKVNDLIQGLNCPIEINITFPKYTDLSMNIETK